MGRHVPVILALGKLKQEDCHTFEASLGYRVRPSLERKAKRIKNAKEDA